MIMEGSNMFKTEYDLKAIMYSAYDTRATSIAALTEASPDRKVQFRITLTPYMVFPLFATRFDAYASGILVSLIQPHLF